MSVNFNNINSGSGSIRVNDNVIGDKNFINKSTDSKSINEVAQDVKVLIAQFSKDYDSSTASGKMMIISKVMETIENTPTLKHRVISSLKEAGTAALESAIDHPIAKVLIAGVKGFID